MNTGRSLVVAVACGVAGAMLESLGASPSVIGPLVISLAVVAVTFHDRGHRGEPDAMEAEDLPVEPPQTSPKAMSAAAGGGGNMANAEREQPRTKQRRG
jgi:hypothetical protein